MSIEIIKEISLTNFHFSTKKNIISVKRIKLKNASLSPDK